MREKGGVALRIVVLDGGTTNPGDLSWEPLEQLGQLTVYSETPSSLVLERLQSAQAAILNRVVLGREEFSQLPDLRYVGTLATGYNTIDVRAAREYGVTVCNVPRYCEAAVAQHALSLLLCLCNKVERSSCLVREGRWEQAVAESHQSLALVELAGKRLGILGYGSTGRRMAQLGLALGMEVLLCSRTRRPAPGSAAQKNPASRAGGVPLGGAGNPVSGKRRGVSALSTDKGNPGAGGRKASWLDEAHSVSHQYRPGRAAG